MKPYTRCILVLCTFLFAFTSPVTAQGVPPGFKALFNGRNLDGWVTYNCPRSKWEVSGGELRTDGNDGRNGWLLTEDQYGDFELRLEFMIFSKANSGVALRCPIEGDPAFQGMEVQIQDDESRPQDGPIRQTGAVYNVIPRSQNALKAIGEWNQLRITMQGRRIAVTLNDTSMLDASLDDYKDAAARNPGIHRPHGRIGLQTHFGTVKFRNIVIKPLNEVAAGSASTNPQAMLVLDAGGHLSRITEVLFTPDQRQLISVSEDKTIRIWDVATGTLQRVLRVPAANGTTGILHRAALSPDGRILATGGWGPAQHFGVIYLIDLQSGKMIAALDRHNGTIHALAFLPDGRHLVSGSADKTAYIWDTRSFDVVRVLKGHENNVVDIAVAPDGQRIATASTDKTARIWNVATGAPEQTLGGHTQPVVSVAWSPDGRTIATNSYSADIRLWDADGTFRKVLPDPDNLARNYVRMIRFTPDSRQLMCCAAGSYEVGRCACLLDIVTGKMSSRVQNRNTILSCAISADGRLGALGGFRGEELKIFRTSDGKVLHQLQGKNLPVFSAAWHRDGEAIAFGQQSGSGENNERGDLERSFSLTELGFGTKPLARDYRRVRTARAGLELKAPAYKREVEVLRDNEVIATLKLPSGWVWGHTFLSDTRVAVAGTTGLYLFSSTGQYVGQLVGHTSDIWAVSPSPNGKYLLTASNDCSLKIWSWEQGKLLVSLFVAGDDWIAWTPEGYYAASPGGEQLMGWQLYRGFDELGEFHAAADFRKTFYRPDVIKLLLQAGSLDAALARANKDRGVRTERTEVTRSLPPRVAILTPGRQVTSSRLDVEVEAEGNPNNPITGLRLFLNGNPVQQHPFNTPQTGKVTRSFHVDLPPGTHRLTLKATGKASDGTSSEVEFTYAAAGTPRPKAGTLYLLVVGINNYPNNRLKLDAAVPDAKDMEEAFKKYGSALFQRVESKLLLDSQATKKNILDGLDWLQKQAKPNDIAVMFYAGHGSVADQWHLLPVDVNVKDLQHTGISNDTLRAKLGNLPCSRLLLLDACFSGAFDDRKRKKRSLPTQADNAVRELAYDDGLVVFCGAAKEQEAIEENGHGFFTKSFVEGLSGKGSKDRQGLVTIYHLATYVRDRMLDLSNNEQEPTISVPSTVRSFALSRP